MIFFFGGVFVYGGGEFGVLLFWEVCLNRKYGMWDLVEGIERGRLCSCLCQGPEDFSLNLDKLVSSTMCCLQGGLVLPQWWFWECCWKRIWWKNSSLYLSYDLSSKNLLPDKNMPIYITVGFFSGLRSAWYTQAFKKFWLKLQAAWQSDQGRDQKWNIGTDDQVALLAELLYNNLGPWCSADFKI